MSATHPGPLSFQLRETQLHNFPRPKKSIPTTLEHFLINGLSICKPQTVSEHKSNQRQTHFVRQNRKLSFLIRAGMEIGEKRFRFKSAIKKIHIKLFDCNAGCLVLNTNREIFIQLWVQLNKDFDYPPSTSIAFIVRTWTMFLMIGHRNLSTVALTCCEYLT